MRQRLLQLYPETGVYLFTGQHSSVSKDSMYIVPCILHTLYLATSSSCIEFRPIRHFAFAVILAFRAIRDEGTKATCDAS